MSGTSTDRLPLPPELAATVAELGEKWQHTTQQVQQLAREFLASEEGQKAARDWIPVNKLEPLRRKHGIDSALSVPEVRQLIAEAELRQRLLVRPSNAGRGRGRQRRNEFAKKLDAAARALIRLETENLVSAVFRADVVTAVGVLPKRMTMTAIKKRARELRAKLRN